MIGRSHRFHGYNSVLPVYKSAKVVRTDGCSLHYKLNPRRRQYRLAVVVSRKVSKSAVQRNRIRRRIYEIVRQMSIPKPYDLIITVYDESFAKQPAPSLKMTLENLIQKSSLE